MGVSDRGTAWLRHGSAPAYSYYRLGLGPEPFTLQKGNVATKTARNPLFYSIRLYFRPD